MSSTNDATSFSASECVPAPLPPRPVRRRTMGEVYPIMRGSIYEDDECDLDESVGTQHDCAGFLLSTTIILLFFKYSQEVVVQAVKYALASHPGLKPNDVLIAGVISVSHEMKSVESMAAMIAWSYARQNIRGYDVETLRGSSILNLLYTLERSVGLKVRHAYVLYEIPAEALNQSHGEFYNTTSPKESITPDRTPRMTPARSPSPKMTREVTPTKSASLPLDVQVKETDDVVSLSADAQGSSMDSSVSGLKSFIEKDLSEKSESLKIPINDTTEEKTRHWGRVACLDSGSEDPNVAALCTIVDSTGKLRGFNGTDVTDTLYGHGDSFVDNIERVKDVQKLTRADAVKGVWQRPLKYTDPIYNQTLDIITFTIPIAFDAENGRCTAGAGVDVALSDLADAIDVPIANNEIVFVDSRYFSEQGGLFVVDTIEKELLTSEPFAVTNSPRERINEMASAVLRYNKGTLMKDAAFFENGFLYQSITMMNTWALLSRAPLALSASDVRASFLSTLKEKEHLASTAAFSYRGPDVCEFAANSHEASRFLESLGVLQVSRRSNIRAFYVAYEIRGSAAGWGACGCVLQDADEKKLRCFYTNSIGIMISLNGVQALGAQNRTFFPFNTTRRGAFVNDVVRNVAKNITMSNGFWTEPYTATDEDSDSNTNVLTYILPFGDVTDSGYRTAVIVEVNTRFISGLLSKHAYAGTSDLFLIDRRGNRSLMGTHCATSGAVRCAAVTQNATSNRFTKAVHSELGGSFNSAVSFLLEEKLVNYLLVGASWGIIEIIPTDLALDRFLPTPTVTGASDALRLLPTSETIRLFLYVAGILAAYLLNLLVLGCSSLGRKPEKQS